MRRAFTDRNTYLGDPAFVAQPDRPAALARSTPPSSAARSATRATATPDVRAGRPTGSLDHALLGGGRRRERGELHHDAQQQLRQRGHGHRRGLPAQRRDGRLRHRAGQAEHVRPGAGRGQRDRPGQADAVGHDAEHRARSGGQLLLVVGTPGGPRIITMVYHVISNVIDHRMSLPEAVEAPRMHHQALPDTLEVEPDGFPPATLDSLRARGHAIAARRLLGRRRGDHPDARRAGRG